MSHTSAAQPPRELVLDHVMFPTYMSDDFIDLVEEIWTARKLGKVFTQKPNRSFKPVYARSRSFYVEYLSNVQAEPFWSNAIYLPRPR